MRVDLPYCGFKNCRYSFDGNCTKPSEQGKCDYWYLLHEELPSAEPERKTAEWIYGENGGQDGWYCSQCGLFIPWDYEYYGLDNIDFIADFHTCPKCDRKMLKYTGMRGEQE